MYLAEEDLIEFLSNSRKKNNFDYNFMNKYITKYGLSIILVDFLNNKNLRNRLKHFQLISNQIKMNKLQKQDLLTLLTSAEQKNLKIIPLKGLFLAEEIYKIPETRISSDIDLLVDINEFIPFINICRENGYTFKDGSEITDISVISYLKDKYREHHFWTIHKEHNYKGKQYFIELEVHTELILKEIFALDFDNNIINNIMNRCYLYNSSFKKNVWHLDKNDNVLYLQLHFLQHFFRDILTSYINGKINTQIKLNLLHDIIKYYDIHHKDIDWEVILSRSINMNVAHEIGFCLNIINCIYPNRICDNYIKRLINYPSAKNGFTSHASVILSNIDLDDILFGNFTNILNNITKKIRHNNIKLNVSQNVKNSDYFKLDPTIPTANLVCCDSISNELNYSIKGILSWDDNSLKTNIEIVQDNTNFSISYTKKDYIFFENQDYVALYITHKTLKPNQPFIRRLVLKPIYIKNSIALKVQNDYNGNYGNDIWDIPESDYMINITNNSYSIHLDLSWSKLEIVPESGLTLGFDIRFYHFIQELNKTVEIACYNPNRIWHDPANFVGIKLTK